MRQPERIGTNPPSILFGEGEPQGEQQVNEQLLQRITINPKVMAGKPVIHGTRVPVELIVRMLSQGLTEGEILREYPRLESEDIRAALAYASQVLAFEEVIPLSVAA